MMGHCTYKLVRDLTVETDLVGFCRHDLDRTDGFFTDSIDFKIDIRDKDPKITSLVLDDFDLYFSY